MSESKDKPNVSYTLFENGLDFVLSAVEHLSGAPDNRRLKYAILHLYSGTLLILKERLRREHWSWLFADPDRASKEGFESGEFHGPNLTQCIDGLETIGIDISQVHERELRLLASKRKKLEHFEFTDSVAAITAVSADILGFLMEFIGVELGDQGLEDNSAEMLHKIRTGLKNFRSFVEARQKFLRETTPPGIAVLTCPTCLEDAWIIDKGVLCSFCGFHVTDGEIAAAQYIRVILAVTRYTMERDGDVWPQHECPECDVDALVDCGERYVCFSCGAQWYPNEMNKCGSCAKIVVRNDMAVCDDCFWDRVRKDD